MTEQQNEKISRQLADILTELRRLNDGIGILVGCKLKPGSDDYWGRLRDSITQHNDDANAHQG